MRGDRGEELGGEDGGGCSLDVKLIIIIIIEKVSLPVNQMEGPVAPDPLLLLCKQLSWS